MAKLGTKASAEKSRMHLLRLRCTSQVVVRSGFFKSSACAVTALMFAWLGLSATQGCLPRLRVRTWFKGPGWQAWTLNPGPFTLPRGEASLGVDDKQIWHLTKVYW